MEDLDEFTPEGNAETRASDAIDFWIFDGIAAGCVGAAIVSLVFLAIDVAGGQALRTPATLGAAVFLGQSLEAGAPISAVMVTGYTVLHGAVFVTVGLAASYSLLQVRHRIGPLFGLALAGALFVGLEMFFVAFLAVFAPGLIASFGTGNIATANLLAAGGIAATALALSLHRSSEPKKRPAHAHA